MHAACTTYATYVLVFAKTSGFFHLAGSVNMGIKANDLNCACQCKCRGPRPGNLPCLFLPARGANCTKHHRRETWLDKGQGSATHRRVQSFWSQTRESGVLGEPPPKYENWEQQVLRICLQVPSLGSKSWKLLKKLF